MTAVEILPLLRDILHRNGGASLDFLARRAGRSRFQAHRAFKDATGETLKQFTIRVQLENAAARLAATDDSVLRIALSGGFTSHEVFTRAFRRYFGISPTQYRATALSSASKAERLRHWALTRSIAPCIRFFHAPVHKSHAPRMRSPMTTLSITRKEMPEQHILFIRRRIAPSEMKETLGECFGKLFTYGAKAGLPIAGQPLCRYVSTGLGIWTIEPAMPLAAPAAGEGEMQSGILPAGPVALGIHGGLYQNLPDTNAAIERWIEANGYAVGGNAWEQYVTDPGEYPNPNDWRTEVYWPLAK